MFHFECMPSHKAIGHNFKEWRTTQNTEQWLLLKISPNIILVTPSIPSLQAIPCLKTASDTCTTKYSCNCSEETIHNLNYTLCYCYANFNTTSWVVYTWRPTPWHLYIEITHATPDKNTACLTFSKDNTVCVCTCGCVPWERLHKACTGEASAIDRLLEHRFIGLCWRTYVCEMSVSVCMRLCIGVGVRRCVCVSRRVDESGRVCEWMRVWEWEWECGLVWECE